MQLRRKILLGTAAGFAGIFVFTGMSFVAGSFSRAAQAQAGFVMVEMTEERTFDPPTSG